ncbi:MAG: hypothetical protein ACP5XB_01710 [Isosphaeraceae bacterium]
MLTLRFASRIALLLVLTAPALAADGGKPVPRRVYAHLLDPREHPDYDRRAVKPPSWETFGNRTHFTCLRGFGVEKDRIVGHVRELDRFTKQHELGDVIWPSYPILFAQNLGDLADEIKRRGFFLFDIWGYVPGSGPGGYWQQFRVPTEALKTLTSKLGDHWLGTDIGEQDGRYIGGYADQMTPASASRFDQYLNFQRHFERMSDDLGHRHATLVSLNFGHYLLKEGTFTLIGAETAQALPNNQVYYAFIRGAGKQYGVPWFGNASVYNRWGYKSYGGSGGSGGDSHGPNKGTSLSLLKRLLYSHILYNCVAVGFENGWLNGETLSPIGRIQQSALRWVRRNGEPGVLQTPVALLLDFHAGWTFPRHLYSGHVYRVWGNLPYEQGDYLTDGILDLLYPGYRDSSYWHDESGFIAPTPYGDIADCLLSDAPGWLLERYPVVVVAGELAGGREIRDKLQRYVEHGGRLVMTSGNLAKLPGGLAGRTKVDRTLVATCGRGTLTVIVSPFGVERNAADRARIRSEVDRPLPMPYVLTRETRAVLDEVFRQQMLFDVGRNLSVIMCKKVTCSYTLGIVNNGWTERALEIKSLIGPIQSIRELALDTSERSAEGFLPEEADGKGLGRNTRSTIAGGDIRVFEVKVKESGVVEIAHKTPPARPRGRWLTLRDQGSIKESMLARPTFFEQFDGVVVDWRRLRDREGPALAGEAGWIGRQGLHVAVDLSSGLDLYPALRLVDNDQIDFSLSMTTVADVLHKMGVIGSRDLILSLHRHPENNFTNEQTRAAFVASLKEICRRAGEKEVKVHLRQAFGKPPWSLGEMASLIDQVGASNLRIAASTALLAHFRVPVETVKALQGKLGLWLLAAPEEDVAGDLWNVHAPLHRHAASEAVRRWLSLSPDLPLVSDAVLTGPDEEYLEAMAIRGIARSDQ